MIDIVQEPVQCRHALHQAGLQARPFGGVDHARDDIEGNQPFLAGVVAVDGKGDPHALEVQLGLGPLLFDQLRWLLCEPFGKRAIVRPYSCRSGIHFVIKVRHRFLLSPKCYQETCQRCVSILLRYYIVGTNHA